MEPVPSVDQALSGVDLSWAEPPEPRRMAGLRRRAMVAAAFQVLYPVFAVVVIGGSMLGLVDPGSDAVLIGEALSSFPGLIAFLYWFIGAYRLAGDLSPYPLQSSPRWSVAQFFIPIVSLFMPYQRMREVEEVSASGARGTLLDETKGSQIVVLWWAAWILSLAVSLIVGGVESVGVEGQAVFATGLLIVGATVFSNVTTALVALHIDAGQQSLAEALEDAQPLAPEVWA